MPSPTPDNDPRPVPPERPGDNECCQSGCDPCVFDFYNDEMERYRVELRAWEARHAAAGGPSGKDGSATAQAPASTGAARKPEGAA